MQLRVDMKQVALRGLVIACCCWIPVVHAQLANEEETLQLVYGSDRMVSIATGSEQLLYKAPAVASVITRHDIENSSARNLKELLEMVPGLHISQDYFAGDDVYTMRGFFREPDAGMLVMINGTTINTLERGSRFAAFRMALNNIEQIEIIRGPGSAVYGADAFVGVINIITRQYQPGQEAGFQVGSFSSSDAWMQNNFRLGQWQNHLSLQYQKSDGDDNRVIERDLQSFLDDTAGTSASDAPGVLPTGYETIDFEFNASLGSWNINQWFWMSRDQQNGHGIPGLDVIDPEGSVDSRTSLTSLSYDNRRFTQDWSLNIRLSFMDHAADRDQRLLPPGSEAPVGSDGNLFTPGIRSVTFPAGMLNLIDSHEQHTQFEASSFYHGWNDHSVRLSMGYELEKYMADESRNFGPGILDGGQTTAPSDAITITDGSLRSLPDGERELVYLSVQDEWDFKPDWTLTAGVRYDDYSDFGNTINPRLALVWQTRYDLSTKLLYGRAFRAPIYRELKLQNQLGFNGNPELDPETIDTLELSLDYRPVGNFRGNLSLYTYRAKDLIFPVEDTTIANTFTFENSGSQKGHGFELEMSWQATRNFGISANFAWQDNELEDVAIEAPYAPESQLYTRIIWNPHLFWSVVPEIHYLGTRPRQLGEPRSPLDNSTRIDLLTRYNNHYNDWSFSLRIRNLLDEKLYEPSIGNDSITGGAALPDDIPMEGRRIMAELRYFIDG